MPAMPNFAYFRGRIVPYSDAKVGVLNHTLNYGTGAFAGIRAYWNEEEEQLFVFRPLDHFRRFLESAKLLCMEFPYTAEKLADALFELLRTEGYRSDAYDSALAAVKAVGQGKVAYINMALDITPWCDCVNYSDRPIVPNVGVFASWDPVAIDSACIQKVKDSAGMPDSLAMTKGAMAPGTPRFSACGSFLGVSEDIQPNVGQKIGMGTRKYELVEVTEAEDPTPFLCSTVPAGAKLGPAFAKKGDVYPKAGFKSLEEVDFEDVRMP